jgi:hypothetical protein
MAHIENSGYATVSSDPNQITNLQNAPKIKIAILEDTSKIWRYVPSNPAGQRWVELKTGNHELSEITDYTGASDADNYNKWNLKTNGFQRTGVFSDSSVDFVGGANVTISYSAGGVVTFSVPPNVDTKYSVPEASSGSVISLSNNMGNYMNMSAPNSSVSYVIEDGEVLGGFAIVLINALSEPTFSDSGVEKIKGSIFAPSNDMHMVVHYFGETKQYYFIEL